MIVEPENSCCARVSTELLEMLPRRQTQYGVDEGPVVVVVVVLLVKKKITNPTDCKNK